MTKNVVVIPATGAVYNCDSAGAVYNCDSLEFLRIDFFRMDFGCSSMIGKVGLDGTEL